MEDRGKVLYREKRTLFGIKNRMFLKYGFIVLSFIIIMFSYFIWNGELACLAPIGFISIMLITIGIVLYFAMNVPFIIFEKGIQFSNKYVGYVPFDEIREIKFGITKRNLAKYIVVKRKKKGSKNLTIAGNDYRTPWELTNDVDSIKEVLIPHWNEMKKTLMNLRSQQSMKIQSEFFRNLLPSILL